MVLSFLDPLLERWPADRRGLVLRFLASREGQSRSGVARAAGPMTAVSAAA